MSKKLTELLKIQNELIASLRRQLEEAAKLPAKLEVQNAIMYNALQFYADKDNWGNRDMSNCKQEICAEDLQEFRPNRKALYIGGLLAREALKVVKK
jgi:hypothetical protein